MTTKKYFQVWRSSKLDRKLVKTFMTKTIVRFVSFAKFRNSYLIRTVYFRLPITLRIKIRTYIYRSTFAASTTNGNNLYSEEIENFNLDLSEVEFFFRHLNNIEDIRLSAEPRSNLVGDAIFVNEDAVTQLGGNLSFDFWDTLFGRYVPAEAIKKSVFIKLSFDIWKKNQYRNERLSVAELYARRVEIESELVKNKGEAQVKVVYEEVLNSFGIPISEASHFVELEGELEVRFAQPLPTIFDSFELSEPGKLIISDYYGTKETISAIIDSCVSGSKKEYDVIVSSEHLSSKRDSGKLFQSAGVANSELWLHIGDNPSSDGQNAENHGARVELVKRLPLTVWNSHDSSVDELADALPFSISEGNGGAFLSDLGVVTYTVVTSAFEEAIKAGKKKVVYLSREGWILSSSHTRLLSILIPYEIFNIQGQHLECSRASTFFPSFWENVEEGLEALSFQYPISNGESISQSMGLTDALAHQVKLELGFSEKVKTRNVWSLLSETTRAAIKEYLREQATLIKTYLKILDITPENSILCDVGWRGTIQDSLSRILGRDFEGIYLGLYSPFANVVSKGRKTGILVDENTSTNMIPFLNFFGPLERALTIPGYQVLRYENDSSGTIVKPVYSNKFDGPSNARNELITSSFDQVSELVFKKLSGLGVFGLESRVFASKTLLNWYKKPTFAHSSTWFSEMHREGFGVSSGQHYFHPLLRRSEDFYPITKLKLNRIIRDSQWPEGFISWVANPESKGAGKHD